jgi:hypothetical protein
MGNGAFDRYMIYLSIVLSVLSFGVEIGMEPPMIVRIVTWVGKA